MNKKTKFLILAGIICSVLLGFFSFGYFTGYGGNRCNISYHSDPKNPDHLIQAGSCDCFCCNGPYGQGYESCGMFGLFLGIVLGAIIGIFIAHLIWKIRLDKKTGRHIKN